MLVAFNVYCAVWLILLFVYGSFALKRAGLNAAEGGGGGAATIRDY